MKIRKSTKADLGQILQIYAYARTQMKKNGNPLQWGDHRPSEAVVEKDIADGNSYVMEQDGRVCGVFAFIIGIEPTYRAIEDGQWRNEAVYGTIHRLASNGTVNGICRSCLAYCGQQIANIRVDTHKDNQAMRHILEAYGFEKCGTIYVEDGSPRIAYQKCGP